MKSVVNENQNSMGNVLWSLTEFDVQLEALRVLGKMLTDEEIDIAQDAFSWGFGESIHIIYNNIFTELKNDNP
jgi:hypothetical protein